jgi:hypothetical protein
MGFAFEHRGREPERTFRNDRYSEFQRGPVHEDPRVTEERERALLRAAFAASRKLDPQEATRPALAEKLNGPQAAGLVLQREPIQEQEPETIQRQVSGTTEAECYEAYAECSARCGSMRGDARKKAVCRAQCAALLATCVSQAAGRKIIDDANKLRDLFLLAVAFGLVAIDGPIPAGDVLAAMLVAYLLEQRRSPGPPQRSVN